MKKLTFLISGGSPFDGSNGRRQQDHSETANQSDYEYIVVGSGPGGGPLAARLALNGHRVLLIDAGNDEGSALEQQVPALHLQSTEYVPTRWDYFVHHYPDGTRQELDSKMTWKTPSGEYHVGSAPPDGSTPLGILYPRAGTLGGCAAHNALVTVYPHESDWNNLVSITGDESWAPENMRGYFQRLERSRYLPNSVSGHGFDGWLGTGLTDLSLVVEDPKLLSLITAAATTMGKGIGKVISTIGGLAEVLLRDLNNDYPSRDTDEGLYQIPIAVLDSKRSSPRKFVLDTANAVHSNGTRKYHLDVRLNTLVTNVRFEPDNGAEPRATGVDFLDGRSLYSADPRSGNASPGTKGSVNATREVIISGGTFNSPQLLKLSGIGPREELEKFDIPVVVDLPGVGTNLQDHYETSVVGETESDFTILEDCTFLRTQPDPCLEKWQNSPILKGAYGTNGIALAIVKKSTVADDDDDADILVSGAPGHFSGYFPGYAEVATGDARHWSWIVLKAHPRNKAGSVTLRSADPRDTPIINFNYFDSGNTEHSADENDLQAMFEGMEYAREIFDNVIPLDGSFEEIWPGRDNVSTTGQMKDFVKREAWGHHASCTCPIGADDDPDAVLDSKFRVRGVKGLRVVDASVFPKIPGTYTALSTYIVSEKAADVVLEDA